jgi:uncharacterized protein (DUF433 family)
MLPITSSSCGVELPYQITDDRILYMNEKPVSVATQIEIRANRSSQPRAYIGGTRVRVRDIYVQSEIRGMTPDEIVVALPHLSLSQVHAALSYYFDNRETILDEIRQDDKFVEAMKTQAGPGLLEQKRRATNGDSHPS